jgi:hypothetical protein
MGSLKSNSGTAEFFMGILQSQHRSGSSHIGTQNMHGMAWEMRNKFGGELLTHVQQEGTPKR